ncbi:MAG: hypothetical protein ACI9R3_004000 [Verrucomicrobiales bacterium]|jgi:uncharacterized protein (TIGR02600 family)
MRKDVKYLNFKWSRHGRRKNERGVAIITVLSVLVLMTVMIVSFFALATNDLKSSRANVDGLRAASAKDIAINLAVGQIRTATSREGTVWVSQPGVISLFGPRDRTGTPASIIKLYSARSMSAGRVSELAADVPNDWNLRPSQFVDLNRPTLSPNPSDPENLALASVHFPIVDPRAYRGEGEPGSVEGFDFNATGVTGIVKAGADYLKRLPMPVQWLYVLLDGTIGYLDAGNRFVGNVVATAENPIVSRIAFWTDDDSCKVNVNTASEGVFWDTPRADTTEDRSYAKYQPQTGEFQRYPGHPAMTSLSSVLFPYEGSGVNGRLDPEVPADLNKMETLWKITPGIGIKGSRGGTQLADDSDGMAVDAEPYPYHLYTAPEEILFGGEQRGSQSQRQLHPQLTREKLEHARFFMSTRSRAPETTHLSKPRMSMWPVAERSDRRTGFDKVFAFCSTIGGGEYSFQRGDAYSRHGEFYNRSNGRNETLYDYMKAITDEPMPGFGSSFASKYGGGRFSDRDNLLAESFDYIRGVNLYDSYNSWSYTRGGENDRITGHGQIAPICLCGGTEQHRARWGNSRLPLPKGFGRIFGLSEVGLFAIVRAERISGNEYRGAREDVDRYDLQPGQKLIQLGFLLETFAPAQGWTSLQPEMSASFGGGSGNTNERPPASLTLNGEPLKWAAGSRRNDAANFIQSATARPKDWIAWGGSGGVRMFDDVLSFEPVVIDGEANTLQFSGTESDPLRVILYDTRTSSFDVNNLVQSYQLAFPQATFPMPVWWSPNGTRTAENSLERRMQVARTEGAAKLFSTKSDVIQSLVPNHGDYRLICSKRVIESDEFVPHPQYGQQRMAHALMDYVGTAKGVQHLAGAQTGGEFIPGIDYPAHRMPDFPINTNSSLWASTTDEDRGDMRPAVTGDFDTGVGSASDGAYINKADDGDVRSLGSSQDPYFDQVRSRRDEAQALFAPNRLIPSPGMLGSLPTGVQSGVPWQTLLFRPHPTHFGSSDLPDHMWMDAFWMPVVQPYAISEPFSTAGKLNINFQIQPFSYIRRATAMHSLMKSEKMLAIPNDAAAQYKDGAGKQDWRHFINVSETLKQWDEKFDNGEVFRSASEICEMYLVPEGQTWKGQSGMEQFWAAHKLTGDNVKERPYTNIYPRLTVRSNVFTVHFVAQSLTKVKGSGPDGWQGWQEGRDTVAGEYRGSAVIERHIDPNDPAIPDFAEERNGGASSSNLDQFYSYRIVNVKRFAP